MDFLSLNEGTERIELGNGFWVDVKKCLTHEEKQFAQAKLGAGRQSVDMGGRRFAEVDPNGFETELIVQSLVDWNLTDKDGLLPLDAGARFAGRGNENPWPPGCPRRVSVARLPGWATTLIYNRCNELNGTDSKEAATFPDRLGEGGEGRDGGAAGTAVVPDPGGVLGAPGGDEGEPGHPAVA